MIFPSRADIPVNVGTVLKFGLDRIAAGTDASRKLRGKKKGGNE